MRDRAVESVIGFILVFSLIASSVGVVYVFGFEGLQDTRDAEQLSNVESAFDVLADNVEDVQREGAPHRATEFKLYRATLQTGEPVEFSVRVTNWDQDGDSVAEPLVLTEVDAVPIVYSPSGSPTTIRYVNGAIVREERGGSVMLEGPPFVIRERGTERTAVFPFVQTQETGRTAISGSTTVLVRADALPPESPTAATDPSGDTAGDSFYDVELTVRTSPSRADAWVDHLNGEFEEEYGVEPCSEAPAPEPPGTVTCTFETHRLFVSATRIDVSVEG